VHRLERPPDVLIETGDHHALARFRQGICRPRQRGPSKNAFASIPTPPCRLDLLESSRRVPLTFCDAIRMSL